MMKVLVTGANGLLATNTIIELLDRGYQVKGLIRNKNKFIYCIFWLFSLFFLSILSIELSSPSFQIYIQAFSSLISQIVAPVYIKNNFYLPNLNILVALLQ